MKIYISGAITGLEEKEYRKAFSDACVYLTSKGHKYVDPSQLGQPEHRSWHYYMKEAIPLLCKCDAIYMLEGWYKSRGAQLEHTIAKALDMPVFEESREVNLDKGGYGK
jgi:hypothetical protein